MSNTIRWYKSVEMDAPELNSPQPCPRGSHCDYRVEKDGELVPACCRFVHPGEEGNGRRIFPARQVKDTGAEAGFYEQPACVRLTGGAGFYERRRLRLSWGEWCEKQGIPYTPVKKGEKWEPVTLGVLQGSGRDPSQKKVPVTPAPAAAAAAAPPLTKNQRKNQRKRVNKKEGRREDEVSPPPPLPYTLGAGRAGCTPGCACVWGGKCHDAWSEEEYEARAAAAACLDTRTEEEMYGREADCRYCDPRSSCDGDHGDEMRDGFIVRKGAAAPVHDTSVPAGGGCVGCVSPLPFLPQPLNLGGGGPSPPPRLNLGFNTTVNYGFSTRGMEGSHSPRLPLLATASCEVYEAASPRLPRFETANTEDDDSECETPRLDAPLSCTEIELKLMAEEGGMEALD